jgi:hypothetical protein
MSGEAYLFGEGQAFYAARFAFYYAMGKNRRHLIGVQVPFLVSDYAGMSTKMGIGDVYFGYFYTFYRNQLGDSPFQAGNIGLTTFAPTGSKEAGLSRTDWVFIINSFYNIRFNERWAIYPMARYLFSIDSTTSKSIPIPPGNTPEPESADSPKSMVSSLQLEAQVIYEMPKVAAWIMMSPEFMYDFERKNAGFALQSKIGKMFNKKFGMSFSWSVNIAGQESFKHAFQVFLIHYLK